MPVRNKTKPTPTQAWAQPLFSLHLASVRSATRRESGLLHKKDTRALLCSGKSHAKKWYKHYFATGDEGGASRSVNHVLATYKEKLNTRNKLRERLSCSRKLVNLTCTRVAQRKGSGKAPKKSRRHVRIRWQWVCWVHLRWGCASLHCPLVVPTSTAETFLNALSFQRRQKTNKESSEDLNDNSEYLHVRTYFGHTRF